MRPRRAFRSWLATQFEAFVALRRASGARYTSQESHLLRFDQYLLAQSSRPPWNAEQSRRFLATLEHLLPRSRDNVISVVWPALAYARRHGAAVDPLPPRPPRPLDGHWRQRAPRILSPAEIGDLLAAARAMPPAGGIRAASAATLFGLLVVTGLRIGEALALDVGDVDRGQQVLTVRAGKFGKSRALPLRESVCQALDRYLAHPGRHLVKGPSAPLFVSALPQRLADPTAWQYLRAACTRAALAKPWPRLHDLRHTFAVSCVATWYAQDLDVNAWLPVLSTYLGHVSVEGTRHYLQDNGLLLHEAAVRFAQRTSALDRVSP